MSEELVLAVYKDGPMRRLDAVEDPREFREALAFVVESLIAGHGIPRSLWLDAAHFASRLRGWPSAPMGDPPLGAVTRIIVDAALSPGRWGARNNADGTATVAVAENLAEAIHQLWPDVPVERAP